MIGYLLGGIFIRRCHLVASHRTNTFFSWPEERVKGLDRRTQMTSLSYIQRIINVRAVDRRNANLYTLAILTRGDWWVPPMVACSLNRYPDQWNVMPTIHCAPCQHITDVVLSSVQACGIYLDVLTLPPISTNVSNLVMLFILQLTSTVKSAG